MSAPLTRIFSWMFPAVGLLGERTPSALADGDVCPVLDVFGDGWRLGTTVAVVTSYGSSLAGGPIVILAGDPMRTRRLLAISLLHGGGAAAGRPLLQYVVNNYDTGAATVAGPSIPINTMASTVDILGGTPIILPPNYGLQWSFPATAAGETYGGRAVFWDMPAGARAI